MEEVPVQESYETEPVITERKVWNERNVIFALVLTVFLIAIEFIGVLILDLTPLEASLLGFLLVFIYAVVLFFLIEPSLLREIKTAEVRTVGPREVIRTVERPVIRTVERPVIQEVPKIIEQRVPLYIEKPRKKLNIPRYTYIGSTETKTYHKRTCRFGKLIKKKYKISNNDENYFKRRKFEPCKMCMKKEAKKIEKARMGKAKTKAVRFIAKKPKKKVVKFKAKKK